MRISDWSSDVCSSDHDVLVEELVRGELGFSRVKPNETDRPYYDPSVLLKLYVYGYLNRVLSGHPLEREAGRNAEVMWLMADQLLSVRPEDDRRLPQGRRPGPPLIRPEERRGGKGGDSAWRTRGGP